jgi:hypothetical protein
MTAARREGQQGEATGLHRFILPLRSPRALHVDRLLQRCGPDPPS